MFNIVDLIIMFFILFGAFIGFKRGVIRQGVSTVGMIIILYLSFKLKNPISSFMYTNLPFFSFNQILEHGEVLNILIYESLAFIFTFSILEVILNVVIKFSNILERFLRISMFLELPSKVLGFILGAVEYYILTFIILLLLSQPIFKLSDNEYLNTSKLKEIVMSNTIILSDDAKNLVNGVEEVNKLIIDTKNKDKDLNCKILKVMIDKKIIDEKSLNYLYETKKLTIECKNES